PTHASASPTQVQTPFAHWSASSASSQASPLPGKSSSVSPSQSSSRSLQSSTAGVAASHAVSPPCAHTRSPSQTPASPDTSHGVDAPSDVAQALQVQAPPSRGRQTSRVPPPGSATVSQAAPSGQ